MATLLFSALGTIFGGPLGSAIGVLAARQIGAAIVGSPSREGPRLKDLNVTTSSYGLPIPRVFGRMRVSGSIIWATDLVEHKSKQGGGKGRPSVTTYSYSASFAVALSSRPILGIGRIWADGNLLRGEAGDLKANGSFRLHHGHHDQLSDPLLAAAEGAGLCPAFRGLAYAVFEDLDLSNFFNRIPTLTFEVFADDGTITLQQVVMASGSQVATDVDLAGISGLTMEGSFTDTFAQLSPFLPINFALSAGELAIRSATPALNPILLPPSTVSIDDGDFGGLSGYSRRRRTRTESWPEAIRYYDIARDYQPGMQRAPSYPGIQQVGPVDLPLALTAAQAGVLAQNLVSQSIGAGDTIAWRTAQVDARFSPGQTVQVPGESGLWRVKEWEWRSSGVELQLDRLRPGQHLAAYQPDSGRINQPVDLAAAPTSLVVFELPWDGTGTGNTAQIYVAASSVGAGWDGAALYADAGDGILLPLGSSGRARAVIGTAESALAPSHPALISRGEGVIVTLTAADMILADASPRDLASGANRALLGDEIIQFSRAVSLGNRQWRLSGLLRGRGGTEAAIVTHSVGEPFVLLDDRILPLDALVLGDSPAAMVHALGRGDSQMVAAPIRMRGITRRPLSPVHPRSVLRSNGDITLSWVRRSRASWQWLDGVDVPLHEENESYRVSFGLDNAPLIEWTVNAPSLILPAATVANLVMPSPGMTFHVRQVGSYAQSDPLIIRDPR